MGSFLNKILSVIGYEDKDDYYEEEIIEEEVEDVTKDTEAADNLQFEPIKYPTKQRGSKVLNVHTNMQVKLIVKKPQSYDEATAICDFLKNKRPVVVNLEDLQRDVAQRIIDFLSGATYSLEGNIHTVTNSIFIIAPKNVDVTGEDDQPYETDREDTFSWMK
ncbi:MAG: cell division protein SepF [Clostridia bacterium]|jgi:cell division inhibitor SepF